MFPFRGGNSSEIEAALETCPSREILTFFGKSPESILKDSELINLSHDFPVFNEEIEEKWCKKKEEYLNDRGNLDLERIESAILKDFCCLSGNRISSETEIKSCESNCSK
jgi:hypothetical protein